MAHVDRFKTRSAYEPFNKIARLVENPVPKISGWLVSASSCDIDLETSEKTAFYTEEKGKTPNTNIRQSPLFTGQRFPYTSF